MGVIFSAFVWAYAIVQVPGGWLSDRFGARPVLATIVAYWSVMTAATAAATGAISSCCGFCSELARLPPFRRPRPRCNSGIHARSAVWSKDSRTVRVVSVPPLLPARRLDHDQFGLALRLLHLRRARFGLVDLVECQLSQSAGRASSPEPRGAGAHSWWRQQRQE
jgi:MFS family permease